MLTRVVVSRVRWFVVAGLIVLSLCASGCGGGADGGRGARDYPNVLLVTLDTTRADRLGCYGYRLPTSPKIDALAQKGVQFDHAIAQASVTPVSHAAIFSGRYPYDNGLRRLHGNRGYRMRPDVAGLPGVLSDLGFETGGFISALPCGTRFGLEAGFDHWDDPFSDGEVGIGGVSAVGIVNTSDSQRTALATNTSILEWLKPDEGARRDEDPLFVWAHYFDPHDLKLYPEKLEDSEFFRPRAPIRREQLLAAYDSEVRYMDRHVGEVIDAMSKLERPLIVCVVSDHGEGLGDHGWWSHGILYREQIRVPLIFAGPGITPGRRVSSVVRTIDVAPTILALLGEDPVEHFGEIDGVDLGPLLRGEAEDLGLTAYAESVTHGMRYLNASTGGRNAKKTEMYSLIKDGWKYIHHIKPDGTPGKHELYDLSNDIDEQNSLTEEQPERVAAMQAWLKAADVFWDADRATRGTDLTEEERRRLEDLGYQGEDEGASGDNAGASGDKAGADGNESGASGAKAGADGSKTGADGNNNAGKR